MTVSVFVRAIIVNFKIKMCFKCVFTNPKHRITTNQIHQPFNSQQHKNLTVSNIICMTGVTIWLS